MKELPSNPLEDELTGSWIYDYGLELNARGLLCDPNKGWEPEADWPSSLLYLEASACYREGLRRGETV